MASVRKVNFFVLDKLRNIVRSNCKIFDLEQFYPMIA